MIWILGLLIALVLAFMFPRYVGIVAGVLVVGGALIVAAAWYQGDGAPDAKSLVSVDVSQDSESCPDPQYPLSVTFTNGSERTVIYVSFELQGRRPGFSSPRYSQYESWDRIMQPGQRYSSCWAVNRYDAEEIVVQDLEWTADITHIRFR